MGAIFVLAEHRQGELRDVTFEMLGKGQELAAALRLRSGQVDKPSLRAIPGLATGDATP